MHLSLSLSLSVCVCHWGIWYFHFSNLIFDHLTDRTSLTSLIILAVMWAVLSSWQQVSVYFRSLVILSLWPICSSSSRHHPGTKKMLLGGGGCLLIMVLVYEVLSLLRWLQTAELYKILNNNTHWFFLYQTHTHRERERERTVFVYRREMCPLQVGQLAWFNDHQPT